MSHFVTSIGAIVTRCFEVLNHTNSSLVTAIMTGALAIAAQTVTAWRQRSRERKAVAGALLGEISGYVQNLRIRQTASNFRKMSKMAPEELRPLLDSF